MRSKNTQSETNCSNLLDVKCSCVFTHLSMLAGYCVYCVYCVLLLIGYSPHLSAVVTLGVMVEVCILLYVQAKQLLKFIQFG